jgi:cobalamin biosynthesis Mg chelatase CobN
MMSPNVSDYQQTLPAFVCQQYVEQCVNAHPNDLDGITTCRDTVCGNKTLDDTTSSSSSESASSTASSTRSSSGSGASETASSTSGGSASQTSGQSASATAGTSAASAMNIASSYGTGLRAVGILAAFGLAL